jgi:hypothetical protein
LSFAYPSGNVVTNNAGVGLSTFWNSRDPGDTSRGNRFLNNRIEGNSVGCRSTGEASVFVGNQPQSCIP